MPSVHPSGGDLTRAVVPTTPPAPGWFSITIGAPNAFDSAGAAARVIVSTPEAAATGRMNLSGRSLWATATDAVTSASALRRSRSSGMEVIGRAFLRHRSLGARDHFVCE